jgi:spore germination cell wall hydrolase CwlJ-like protein
MVTLPNGQKGFGSVLLRLRRFWLGDHAAHLAGVQLAVVALLTAGVAIAAAPQKKPTHAIVAVAAPTAQLTPASAVVEAQDDSIRLQDLTPDQARLWNASNPVSTLPNPAARPFRLKADSVIDETRALDCMTAVIYYEAAWESVDGQRAVAQVVLNRMRHPAYPKTVCGVVFQGSERRTGCQFTFTCDGALARAPQEAAWSRARQVAKAALNGYVMKKVGNATHYHANYVAPYWSPNLLKVGQVGAHIFYRWTGGWGLPPAFGGRYQGGETTLQMAKMDGLPGDSAKLKLAALTVEASQPAQAPAVEAATTPEIAPAPAEDLVVAAEVVGAEAAALVKPEELDWAGRPKAKAAPRIAAPPSFSQNGGGLSY